MHPCRKSLGPLPRPCCPCCSSALLSLWCHGQAAPAIHQGWRRAHRRASRHPRQVRTHCSKRPHDPTSAHAPMQSSAIPPYRSSCIICSPCMACCPPPHVFSPCVACPAAAPPMLQCVQFPRWVPARAWRCQGEMIALHQRALQQHQPCHQGHATARPTKHDHTGMWHDPLIAERVPCASSVAQWAVSCSLEPCVCAEQALESPRPSSTLPGCLWE